MQNLPKPLVWAGIMLMFLISSIHLIVAQYAFEDAIYKGLLFVVGAISALIAATGIQEGHLVWGWGLASVMAGAAFAGYLANATIGLPGLPVEYTAWQEPLGLVGFGAEGLMLALAAWVFLATRLALRRAAHGVVV